MTKIDDTSDGACDVDCSLREATLAAASGDSIVFSSLFLAPQTITLSLGEIEITRDLTISGTGAELLAVSGSDSGRIFRISGGAKVSLFDMTLRNGRIVAPSGATGFGGGIFMSDSSLSLTNMILRDNSATSLPSPYPPYRRVGVGGAMASYESTVSMVNTVVKDNWVPDWPDAGSNGISGGWSTDFVIVDSLVQNNRGGGVGAGRTMNVERSSFLNNSGSALDGTTVRAVDVQSRGNAGAGISATDLIMDRCTISNNLQGVWVSDSLIRRSLISGNNYGSPFARGGGLRSTGTTYVYDSAIVNNSATEAGGGVYVALGTTYLTNTTVSGNRTGSVGGGGVYIGYEFSSPTLVLTNTTIAANTVFNGTGGGIHARDTAPFAVVHIRNSIVADNAAVSAQNVRGQFTSEGFNLIHTTIGSTGWLPTDLTDMSPLLAPLGNNGGPPTHAFLSGSPALNGGGNALALDPMTGKPLLFDQRAFKRIADRAVDIGAYEANYAQGPVTVGGRITTSSGRGIPRVRVSFLAGSTTLYTQTNPFGYYRVAHLPTGVTYRVTLDHKRYGFASPIFVTTDQDRDDLNFVSP